VLAGAKTPRSDDSVVMLRLAQRKAACVAGANSGYEAVAVMIRSAITLANAAGKNRGAKGNFSNDR